MEQRVAHPRAPAERAVPPCNGTERTWQSKSGGRVQRAKRKSAREESTNVSGGSLGAESSDGGGDCHLHIVPGTAWSDCVMTDQNPNQWSEASTTTTQPSFRQEPTGLGDPTPPAYLVPPPPSAYASWRNRVRARLIDQFPTYLGLIIFCIGYVILIVQLALANQSTRDFEGAAVTMIVGLGVVVASLLWIAYNRWFTTGRTGQSLGKRLTKIKLIGIDTNAPIGVANAFLRDLVHILDALTLVGYLWPLWDDTRQTFADQIMKTVVINQTVTAGP
jgi:uncharacterized RDD family membrane protein YckC